MIKKYLTRYVIKNIIVSSLFILGNNSQYSADDILLKEKYWKSNFENINNLKVIPKEGTRTSGEASKKTFSALDEIIKNDSAFYSENIKIPKYRIKNEHCSEYATLSAKKLFNKDYNFDNSWNLRYSNKIISKIKDKEELISLAEDTILKPGMIVGFENPDSRYKNYRDRKGKKAEYTHTSLYLGTNGKDLQFAHQFGKKIEKISLTELFDKNLIPKEILDSQKN